MVNKKETHSMALKELKDFLETPKTTLEKDDLLLVTKKVIENNPKAVEDFKKGKESSVQFLFGQVMRETNGKAIPEETIPLIKSLLQ